MSKTGSAARVRRWSEQHVQIDYAPSPDVVEILDRWRAITGNANTSHLIDALLREADQRLSADTRGERVRSAATFRQSERGR